jgi:hypothetical protein
MPQDSEDTTPGRLIEHVVVLMLENRSFDTMLGWLYPGRPDFDGLTGREANPWHRAAGKVPAGQVMVPVWTDPGLSRSRAAGPDPDPGELFSDMEQQFFGAAGMTPDGQGRGAPTMEGFVDNYMRQPRGPDDSEPDPAAIMHCYTPRIGFRIVRTAGSPPRPARPGPTVSSSTRARRAAGSTTTRRISPTGCRACSAA